MVCVMISASFLSGNRQKVFEVLTSSKKPPRPAEAPRKKGREQGSERNPEWTQGLRQLYNSVVEEPLPGNFKDLLDKLDKTA